jgi:hypothetical protein
VVSPSIAPKFVPLSIKKSPERTSMLKAIYDEEFARAASEDRDRAALNLVPGRSSYRVMT